jgi:hypothetical protein
MTVRKAFLAGLLVAALAPAIAAALPRQRLQPYCNCACGSTTVYVTPAGGVSLTNCERLTGALCDAGSANHSRLICSGTIIYAVSTGRVTSTPPKRAPTPPAAHRNPNNPVANPTQSARPQ